MLAILPKLAPWPFVRAGAAVRKATRQAPLFGYALTGNAPTAEFKVTDTYHATGDSDAGWNAFDADGKTSWYPHSQYASAYLQLECTKPRTIQSFYAFQDTSAGLHSGYLATTIKILASNDGTNYVQIANNAMTYAYDSVDTRVYVSQKVTIASPKPYKFYRISIAPTNHPYVCLAGLVLQEPLNTPIKGLVAQYRFIDKEAINEINEAFANLTGTFSVADGKLTTASNNTSYASMPKILFDEGEDFCIKLRHTFTATSQENPILGVWGSGDNSASIAWILWRNGTNSGSDRKVGFGMNTAGANGLRMSTLASVPDNQEVEIEVSRVNGVVYLLLDGVLQASQAYTLGNAPGAGLPDMRTDVYGLVGESPRGGYYNGGQKSALQIYKGKGGHTASYTKTDALETITTPEYSAADSDNVVAQIALRRDNAINEADGTYLIPASDTVRKGRIQRVNAASANTYFRGDRFGDGEFTIETMVNITAINTSGGGVLLGAWFRSDQANPNNRWCIFIDSQRKLQFYIGMGSTTGVALTLNGPTLSFGVDYHIVVERVAGVITLYLNGVEQASAKYAAPLPGFAPFDFRTNSNSGLHSWSGESWNVRIAKKAFYNGAITTPYVLPKIKDTRATYTADEARSIVLQHDFVSPQEEKIGLFPTLFGSSASDSAQLINNVLNNTQSSNGRFNIPVENDWVAGDFTVETTLIVNSIAPSSDVSIPLIAQWPAPGNNSWGIFMRGSTREVGFYASTDGTPNAGKVVGMGWTGKVLNLGQLYHLAVERVGTKVTLYVDGVAAGSSDVPVIAPSTADLTNYFTSDTSRLAAMVILRIRIARKALYNGVIPASALLVKRTWPKFARKLKRVTMASGQATPNILGSTATLTGVAQNLMYQTPAASMGSISDTLFRTLDGKTKRLVALMHQTHNPPTPYLVLFDKDASVAPLDDMPLYTRILLLNGNPYDLANLSNAPANEGFGAVGKAWQVANAFGPFLYTGRISNFEFLPPATVVTIGTVTLPSSVQFKGYMKDLTDVADGGSLTNDQVIDVSNPRACKLYKIRGLWTQSNNYLCIGLETLATDSYANLEKLYPDIINIPRLGTTLFSGADIPGKTFASATTINQAPTDKPPYVQYYWSLTTAQVNALNAGTTVNHYFG